MTTPPLAYIAHVPWWRRLVARFRGQSPSTPARNVDALLAEIIRVRLNKQLAEILEHVHDRDVQIRVLREQVRALGGTPMNVEVMRKPLPTFIPGPGMSVSR